MHIDHLLENMNHKSGQPLGKRSSLTRVPSRRRRGRAVTIEDVMDADDHLHRVSESASLAMGSSSSEVPVEWYTYNGNDSQIPQEPSEETPAPGPADEREAKPSNAEAPGIEQEPRSTAAVHNEDHQAPRPDASSNPTGAAAQDALPGHPNGEIKPDADPTPPETSKSPQPPSPGNGHFFSYGPGQHPMGTWPPWHYQPLHGHPGSPRFVPHFPPPLPPSSPPGFGLPPPPLPPGKQIARIDSLGLSGYELLASRLSGSFDADPPVPPLYRRFKELNHRVLLGLQDELCCLEEMLQNLDNTDSLNRRYRDGILPASRRHDSMEPNEITTARKGVMDQIAYKLFQYNTQLHGFKNALEFKDALPDDVHDYKAFLNATLPVVPGEMRFLDKGLDLLCLPDSSSYYPGDESVSGNMTPVGRAARYLEAVPPTAPSTNSATDHQQVRDLTPAATGPVAAPRGNGNGTGNPRPRLRPLSPVALRHMAVGICMAIILPILSFPVIDGFVSRMTVVALVALGMAVVGVQSGMYDALVGRSNPVEGAAAVGIYVGFMAIVAGTFG